MSNHNQDLKWIESGFAALEAKLNGASNLPVHQLRKQALENLFETGFPSSRDEDWKYTNVKDLLKRSYSLSKKDDSKVNLESIIFSEAGYRLIFVDNSFNSNLSRLPEGISAFTISEILRNPEHESYSNLKLRLSEYTEWGAYAALNTAFSTDGFYLHLKENQKVDQPIHLIFITSSSEIATHPRVILELDKNSSLSIVETYTGSGSKYFTTAVTQINMAEDSYCDHYRIQDEALDAFHFSSLRTTQASSSILKTNSFAFGSALARSEVWPIIAGEYVNTTLNGLNILRGTQHVDNFTVIDHQQANSESHEHYKGVYADQTKGVFSGTIIVRPDAQKTNAFQANNSILLSETAQSHSKPQLKIWADDVKCSHGATVGQLDEQGLFYLMSRGIDKLTAKNILIRAFANEILSQIELEQIKEPLLNRISEKLAVD